MGEGDIKRVVAIAIAVTAAAAGWAGYSLGSNRTWTRAEYESVRVWVAGYCRGAGDGVVYMTSRVTGLSTDEIYGAGHVGDPFVEERLNEQDLSLSVVSDVLGEAVATQLPIALYNWDLADVPSLEGKYSLDRLEGASAASGLVVALRMYETHHPIDRAPGNETATIVAAP